MKKIKGLLYCCAICFLTIFCGVCFCGCELFEVAVKTESAYDIAVKNGFEGSEEEWLKSLSKSAYDVAVENGFEGTEEEWLKSLTISAYDIAVKNGFEGTEVEWLESLKGEYAGAGKSAYDIAVENGFEGTEVEWLASLKGSDGTNGTNGLNGDDGEDGDDVTARELFDLAVEYELFEDNAEGYSQFLSQYLSSNILNIENVQATSAKCLNQVVSIYCEDNEGSLSAGAGVFYKIDTTKKEAFVITNYHVVSCSGTSSSTGYYGQTTTNYYESTRIHLYLYGTESITETTNSINYGKNAITAQFIGGSADYDLALLKIVDTDDDKSFTKIQNSSAEVVTFVDTNNIQLGSTAIAIGNPMGAGVTASSGVISCDSEFVEVEIAGTERSLRCIRVDTTVNPGNSGGGLFDINGNLIGIVNAKSTEYENVNYAIAGSLVKNVADNIYDFYILKYNESNSDNTVGVHKFLVGVTISVENPKNTYDSLLKTNTLSEDTKVVTVNTSSVAESLGFKADDIITKLTIVRSGKVEEENFDVTRRFVLMDTMLTLRVGDKVGFTVKRWNSTLGQYETIVFEKITVSLIGYTEYKGA